MYEDFKKRMERRGHYMGETMRKQSDYIVDATWMNSVSTRPVCVKIIDRGLPPTYESVKDFDNVLWAHFEEHAKYNISKDELDYYLIFRPGELMRHPEIKVGAYVCIPNVDDVPEWWLIMHIDDDNELRKTQILKCNYVLKWITKGKIYNALVCFRSGNSYNSGSRWGDRVDVLDNICNIYAPTNHDIVTINYNQRILVSDELREQPLAWEVSKIEDMIPKGMTKIRFEQSTFDPAHDNAELMLASYYNSEIEPMPLDRETEIKSTATITYNGTKPTVKVGGSYKVFTPAFSNPTTTVAQWFISDEQGDISTDTNYTIEYSGDQLKLKVAQNYNLIGKVLIVQVIGTDGSEAEMQVEVV